MAVITPPVDAGLKSWLGSTALYVGASDAATVARWGDRATDTEYLSPIAIEADADAEAVRQLSFLAGPLARDEHVVQGLRHDLLGKTIRITGTGLGYEAPGAVVFVLRVEESDATDMTTLTVLRRLS